MNELEAAFFGRVEKALNDPQLKIALPLTQERLRAGRTAAAQELGNVEEWRTLASDIRMHTIENLDSYLEQLAGNVLKNGGHVCFAEKAEDAISYVQEVVRAKGAKSIIKSKSMVDRKSVV